MTTPTKKRVAYLTGGTVGAGHYVRGVAVGAGLSRRSLAVDYRMFGPPLDFPVAQADPAYVELQLDFQALGDRGQARKTPLFKALRDFEPSLLIVDMFWALVRHILPLSCPAWLLLRSFPKVWLKGPPSIPFEPNQYARIIAIEPLSHHLVTDEIDPIVVCNPDEMRPRGALRQRLGVSPNEPLVVVTHAGELGEINEIGKLGKLQGLRAANSHIADLRGANALFPLCSWLGDADEIIAAAGYNTYWESRWLGYRDRVNFHPLDRRIDDQHWRLSLARPRPATNGADVLAEWIFGVL